MAGVIVECAIYRDGKPEHVAADLSDALDAAREHDNAFVWLGLAEPTDEEFSRIVDEFGLHPLAVEDAIHAHQRPKLELYDKLLFFVIKPLTYIAADRRLDVGEVMAFVGDRFIVTVRHGDTTALSEVRESIVAEPERLQCGPLAVLHAVIDRIVDQYAEVLEAIEDDIDELEERIFSNSRESSSRRIYELKREVIAFRRSVRPLVIAVERLVASRVIDVPEPLRPFFRDVADHAVRTAETVEGYDDLLTSILGAESTQVTVRQNDDMRRISAWVAIAAVPTALAGIYGMNFHHMPELSFEYGYPTVLGVMLVVCLSLYRGFRRNGWL